MIDRLVVKGFTTIEMISLLLGGDLDMEMCCDESGSGLVPVWLMTKSSLKPLDLKTDQDEGAGLYIVRHGPTDWDAQDNKAPAMASLERRLKSVRVR